MSALKSVRPLDCEHVVVYRRDDEYAGWPFNGWLSRALLKPA